MRGLFWIAWRLLISRKRAFVLSVIGVVISVALFIIAQAASLGVERFFVRTVLGANGAIRLGDRFRETMFSTGNPEEPIAIETTREGKLYVRGIDDPETIRLAVQGFSGVRGVSEILEGQARASSGIYSEPVQVQGINWEAHFPLTSLDEQLVQGSIQQFKELSNGLLLGAGLARRLGVRVGDMLDLTSAFESRRYRVVGIYATGIEAIDHQRLYLTLSEARVLFHEPQGGVYFQITLDNPRQASAIASRLEDSLGHHALSWEERERVWLDVFWLVRFASMLLVGMVILLAGVGMFNSLALLVLEKQKDIAILRAMGHVESDVYAIFLYQGFIIYIIGTSIGCLLGFVGTLSLRYTPFKLSGVFAEKGTIVFFDGSLYVAACVAVAFVVFLASTLPARRAARLEPGHIIRGTSF